jgi:LuxR family maltose regulon positive regulatory protein
VKALQSAQPPAESLLAGLVNEMAGKPDGVVLVLDDLHTITATEIYERLYFLLDHLPAHTQLIISTRVDPPWPMARLRARREMTELRIDDLRFAPHEVAAFLNDVMGLGLSAQHVTSLERRTEGWIAGLQLAALSIRGQDPDTFIRAFSSSHRFILDYLVEEVLDRQPAEVREFLLRTSILDRLTARLCDSVAERDDSRAILARLEQANLFLVPLDDERRWYRYHHLFRDLLHSRLERSHPEQIPGLHRRAAEWYQGSGLISQAVDHALRVGDAELAARLVAGNVLSLVEYGQLAMLKARMDSLPKEAARSSPWLAVARAWVLTFAGQLEAVEPLLADVEESLRDPNGSAEAWHIRGYIAAVRHHVAMLTGRPEQATQLARAALEALPPDDLTTRSWATVGIALSLYRTGDVAGADQALNQAVAMGRAAGDTHTSVMILCTLAATEMEKGRLRQAEKTFQEALQRADRHARRAGRPLPVSAYARVYLARLLAEWDELDAAQRHIEEGIALCVQWGEPELLTGGHMSLAHVRLATGDLAGASEAIRRAKQAATTISAWYADRVAPLEALIELRQGNLTAASRWSDSQTGGHHSHFDVFETWSADLIRARIRLAQGALDEALALSTEVLATASAAGAGLPMVTALIVQAAALELQGRADQALGTLEQALALAEPEGYVHAFIDEGPLVERLLRRARARGISSRYADRLVTALERRRPSGTHQPPPSPLIEPLSERELEVLQLLGTPLSSRQIAERLFISVHTARTHIRNIYGKLGVHSRTEAVLQARELNLL